MSCPGLHCPGCSGGQSLGILAATAGLVFVAAEAIVWVAENLWWIVPTAIACYALAVVAAMALERRSDRRAAEWGAARGIVSRADVTLPARPATPQVTQGTVPAIEYHVHHHHYYADTREPARVITGKVMP